MLLPGIRPITNTSSPPCTITSVATTVPHASLSVPGGPYAVTDDGGTDRRAGPAGRRWFMSLLLAYTLEGVGYIIAGTFLVAAIDQTASTTLGSSAWIIVGVTFCAPVVTSSA